MVSGRVFPAVVDPMKTKMEWSLLKDVFKEQQYPTGKLSMLWSCIFKFHPDTFPNLLKLVQLALNLPLQTADVERETHFLTNITIEEEQCTAPIVLRKYKMLLLPVPFLLIK